MNALAPARLECSNCGAALAIEPSLRTALCPYCASPSVVERPPAQGRPDPAFTLAFWTNKDQAAGSVRSWLKSRGMFAHSGLKHAHIDAIRGIYVPAFLYTVVAHARYTASIGENYQETETYTYTDSQGNTQTGVRTVTHTEWRSLSGQYSSYVMDVVVTASRGVNNVELEMVEPFDMRGLRRYQPALLSGWIAEDPTMHVEECMQLARGEAVAKVGKEISSFLPGDSQKDLNYQTWLERESADLVHVPIWVLAVRHDPQKPPLRLLVNGQNGKVVGHAPVSWVKIVLFIVAILGTIALVILLLSLA
jgi:hypothetical protein